MSVTKTVIHDNDGLLVEHLEPEIHVNMVRINHGGETLLMTEQDFGRMLFSAMHYFFVERPDVGVKPQECGE